MAGEYERKVKSLSGELQSFRQRSSEGAEWEAQVSELTQNVEYYCRQLNAESARARELGAANT